MNNISRYGSSIGGYQGSYASTSEKAEALQASENRKLELSLKTGEGDTVTISAGSFMDFASLSYDKSGKISNGSSSLAASVSSRTISLSSGSQFTFSVKGSLSDEEMDDIENIVKTLDDVMGSMADGDMDGAMAKALGMSDGYDTIAEFEADLSYTSSYAMASSQTESTYQSGSAAGKSLAGNTGNGESDPLSTGLAQNLELPEIPKDSSSSLLDMMLEELDKLREKNQTVPLKAAEPVDQLISHHMEQLKKLVDSSNLTADNTAENTGENTGNGTGSASAAASSSDNSDNSTDKTTSGNTTGGTDSSDTISSLLSQLEDARKGMAQEFRRMMPEAKDFRNIASSFMNNM